jgi:neutral amino acid transport system ATP-binding protein
MITPPLLEVQGVYAGYARGLDILQGVNLSIKAGEMVAVLGANGAGKSTLAKTIFGLLTPHHGSIRFQGRAIAGLPGNQLVELGLGYVPQLANVFPSLTIEENLEMGAFQRTGSLSQLKIKVYDLFPKLAERRSQRAGTLSGGERQMLAMGRALMMEPRLMLLDEPSAALSPILVSSVFEQIQRINQNGTAILLVEQNARKALQIADRGVVLDNGRDCYEGPGQALLQDPKIAELYLGGGSQRFVPRPAP